MREQHIQPTSEQMSHEHFASTNRANFASVNGGRPANCGRKPADDVQQRRQSCCINNNAVRHITTSQHAYSPAI